MGIEMISAIRSVEISNLSDKKKNFFLPRFCTCEKVRLEPRFCTCEKVRHEPRFCSKFSKK